MKRTIAIIGATGNVGRKIVEILIQRKTCLPRDVKLFASSRSAGKTLTIGSHSFIVEDLALYDFKDSRLALFATGSDISENYVPKALQAGCKVIDSSSFYRLHPSVPLIVPPVNPHLILEKQQLFSSSNCLASPISVVLKPLHDFATATRLVVSTYQSTSGAGKEPMDELFSQTQSVINGQTASSKFFPRPIAFNIIPQVDKILEDGFSKEEMKIIHEVQKIVSYDIKIVATSVRVPVLIGHSISLNIEFKKSIDVKTAREILSQSPSIQLSYDHYTTPLEVEGQDDVFVGRLRKDPTVEHGLCLWLSSDNLRRGAALDAVEIAEKIVSQQYIQN